MNEHPLHLVLADDDTDDRLLFKEALEELPFSAHLTQFNYGDQLMKWLIQISGDLPDVLFLDLNMPRKNGFQCLVEIRQNQELKSLPIFIISTSYEKEIADRLYKNGANFYIRKPTNFPTLKQLINQALSLFQKNGSAQPPKDEFVLTAI